MLATRLKGAIEAAAGGGGAEVDVTLYTGTGSGSQTITTGLDYTGSNFILWVFQENGNGEWLSAGTDPNQIDPDSTSGEAAADISTLTSTGFDVDGGLNNSADYVAITLLGATGFMQETTFTDTGGTNNIAHGLDATPELVISKRVDGIRGWTVWSTDMLFNQGLSFNNDGDVGLSPDSIEGVDGTNVEFNGSSGADYVLYAFTPDSGNFDTGTYTGSFGNVTVTTGFEPKTIWVKADNTGSEWRIYWKDGSTVRYYDINAGSTSTDGSFAFTSTGFITNGYAVGQTIHYFAFT